MQKNLARLKPSQEDQHTLPNSTVASTLLGLSRQKARGRTRSTKTATPSPSLLDRVFVTPLRFSYYFEYLLEILTVSDPQHEDCHSSAMYSEQASCSTANEIYTLDIT